MSDVSLFLSVFVSMCSTVLGAWLLTRIDYKERLRWRAILVLLQQLREDDELGWRVNETREELLRDLSTLPKRSMVMSGVLGVGMSAMVIIPIIIWGSVEDARNYLRNVTPIMALVQALLGYLTSRFMSRGMIGRVWNADSL